MVLGELGQTITSAVRRVVTSKTVDESLLHEMLGEITTALVSVRCALDAWATGVCSPVCTL